MNLFFVYDDGRRHPRADRPILEGVTRASIIALADELGHKVDERRVDDRRVARRGLERRDHRGLRLRDGRGQPGRPAPSAP